MGKTKNEYEKKAEVLKEIKNEINEKMEDVEKNKILSGIYSGMISSLLRRLIKLEGYGVTNTILVREMREQGIHDAKMIAKIFNLGNTKEDASKTLKIAAVLIGYNLEVEGDETVVRSCPFARMAIETKERTLCSVCTDYVNGLIEGILGEDYYMEATHDITKEEPICYFQLRKK